MRRFVALAVCLLATSLTSIAQARGVNLVFFGGFGSCAVNGDPAELAAKDRLDDLAARLVEVAGTTPYEIRACFALGSGRLFVQSGSDSVWESTPEEGIDTIARMLSQSAYPTIVLGQSHGGTMASRLAATMASDRVKLLVTIDPISIETCGPGSFTGSYLDWILLGEGGDGCTGLPTEIEALAPMLQAKSGRWLHLYQEDFAPLHSGPSPLADNSIRLEGLDDSAVMGQHAATEVDPGVWRLLTAEALQRL